MSFRSEFKRKLRKKGIWLTPAQAERILVLLKVRLVETSLNSDERELIEMFEKRVKEMR